MPSYQRARNERWGGRAAMRSPAELNVVSESIRVRIPSPPLVQIPAKSCEYGRKHHDQFHTRERFGLIGLIQPQSNTIYQY